MKKIYLAGPQVFYPDFSFEEYRDYCSKNDFIGISPKDNDIYLDNKMSDFDKAAKIRSENVKLIEQCDIVIADISPFRGTKSADPGTVFEIGYASALNKKIVLYSNSYNTTLVERFAPHDKNSNGEIIESKYGTIIENFGLTENLMISTIVNEIYPDFKKAVESLRKIQ